MLQIVRVEKVDENRFICAFSMFFSWVMVLKLSKKVNFGPDLSKKSKSVKAIYIHASTSSKYTLWENVMVYLGLNHHLWDICN